MILFIDGNHENFDMLYNLPIAEFGGGIVHKVDDGIYHLIRGEVYNIDEKKFLYLVGQVRTIKSIVQKEKTGGKKNYL